MPNLVYKPNSFYIEDREGNYVDSIYNNNDGKDVNRLLSYLDEELDIDTLDAAISINHEANHYIQDLSVNACIVKGELSDRLTALIVELSKCKDIRFPLSDQNNYRHNHSIDLNDDYKDILRIIDDLNKIQNSLFGKHTKPDTEKYKYDSPNEDLFRQNEISVDFFLETYAYHKAYWDAFRHFEKNEKVSDLLHELVKRERVYPIHRQGNKFYVDDYNRHIMMRSRYQLINMLLMFSVDNDVENYLDYCKKEIPKNYCGSHAFFTHTTHQLIFEAAINIPSLDHILTEVYCNKKDIEQFSPVHRFYLIIKAIRDNNGYPDSVDGENYFKTFYNWVADKYKWLRYDETYGSIMTSLSERAEESGEIFINYQIKATYCKYLDFITFYNSSPDDIIRQLALPLVISSANGLIFYQYDGNITWAPTGLVNVYERFFGPVYKYESCYNEQDLMSKSMNNSRNALREIICRLFSKSLNDKILRNNQFLANNMYRCPFSDMNCPRKSSQCRAFSSFEEVFPNCCKIISRGDNGGDNTYDCMFYNYLKDINYVPL